MVPASLEWVCPTLAVFHAGNKLFTLFLEVHVTPYGIQVGERSPPTPTIYHSLEIQSNRRIWTDRVSRDGNLGFSPGYHGEYSSSSVSCSVRYL